MAKCYKTPNLYCSEVDCMPSRNCILKKDIEEDFNYFVEKFKNAETLELKKRYRNKLVDVIDSEVIEFEFKKFDK